MPVRTLLLLLAALLLPASACGPAEDDDSGTDTGTDTGMDTSEDVDASDVDVDADVDADVVDDVDADADADDADVEVDVQDEDTGPPPTLGDLYTTIFEPSCGGAGCHLGPGGTAAPVLENDEGLYERLLQVSISGTPMPWITPGEPEESYLLRKLNDTFREVGGFGTLMPLANMPLPDEEIELVEAWILAGAPAE